MAKSKKTENKAGLTLDAVFQLTDRITLSEDEAGIITVMEKQDHKIQGLFRRLKFRIPEHKKTELDDYGSFVFKNINGELTVADLGLKLKDHFGPAIEPLYDRLTVYLKYLEQSVQYIEQVQKP
ncbi:MAG: PqqD family peptide modification chaperone [Clostridiaceae bacterium]